MSKDNDAVALSDQDREAIVIWDRTKPAGLSLKIIHDITSDAEYVDLAEEEDEEPRWTVFRNNAGGVVVLDQTSNAEHTLPDFIFAFAFIETVAELERGSPTLRAKRGEVAKKMGSAAQRLLQARGGRSAFAALN